MTISPVQLNLLVSISRKVTTTISAGLEPSARPSVIATDVPIRITTKVNEVAGYQEKGWNSSDELIGFTNVGIDVQPNDVLTRNDNGKTYVVQNVDKEPGGVVDNHYEMEIMEKDFTKSGNP